MSYKDISVQHREFLKDPKHYISQASEQVRVIVYHDDGRISSTYGGSLNQHQPKEPNIWLDDERQEPEGWIRIKTVQECKMSLIMLNMIGTRCGTLSLDHDLGDDVNIGTGTTPTCCACRIACSRATSPKRSSQAGYDVLNWIEEQLHTNPKFLPPRQILIHTANPAARKRMELALESINRKLQQ